jgi:hypothetical protein
MTSHNRTMEAVNRSMECSITRTHQELKQGLYRLDGSLRGFTRDRDRDHE